MENLGSGSGGQLKGLDPGLAGQVSTAANDAFVHALSSGMWLSASVSAAGALFALFLIAPQARRAARIRARRPRREPLSV